MSKNKFPKVLYVRMEQERDEVPYPIADADEANVIENDGPTTVGVYELVETRTLRKVVERK